MIIFITLVLFFQTNIAQDITPDFSEKLKELISNIHGLNNPTTISVKSVENVLIVAENLQEFIADNFINLITAYNKQDLIDVYTRLNQLSAANIFADKIANLKPSDLSQLDLDASGIWQHAPMEESIYSSIQNAQREVQKTKDRIAVIINNFYRISFLAAKKNTFFSPEEKKLIFLSLSLQEIFTINSVSSNSTFNKLYQAFSHLNEMLIIRTSFIKVYREELKNFETNQLMHDLSNDLQIMALL